MQDNCVPLEMHGVRLRVPRKSSDFEIAMAGINDPEVRQYIHNVLLVYEDEEIKWFDTRSERKSTDLAFTIEFQEGKEWRIVGNMGIHQIDHINRTAFTGTVLWKASDYGKGIGTKAKMILLNYAFNGLNLRKVCSSAIAFNERSINYSLRCGYKEEGRLKDQLYRNGKYYDQVFLGIFRKDFEPLWEQFKTTGTLK